MTFGYNDHIQNYTAATDGTEITLKENGGFLMIIATGGFDLTIQAKDNNATFFNIDTVASTESKTISPAPRGTYKINGGAFRYAIGG